VVIRATRVTRVRSSNRANLSPKSDIVVVGLTSRLEHTKDEVAGSRAAGIGTNRNAGASGTPAGLDSLKRSACGA